MPDMQPTVFAGLTAKYKSSTGQLVDVDLFATSSGELIVQANDGQVGILRTRFISVTTTTASTLAGSGVASWPVLVRKVSINSVRVVSMTSIPLTQGADFSVRYAIDAANDAAAALMVPTVAPTSSATTEAGQIGSFNLTPIIVPDTEVAGDLRAFNLILPRPIEIDLSAGISRLDLVHNIGTAVVLQFGISALEVV